MNTGLLSAPPQPRTRNEEQRTFPSLNTTDWISVSGSCPGVLDGLPQAGLAPARVHGDDGWLENPGASIVLSQWPDRLAVPVGMVSQGYQLVPHRALVEHLLGVLARQGIETQGAKLEAHLTPRGERFLGRLVVPDPGYQFAPDGLACWLTVFFRNAIDGRGGLDVELGWLRLVCTNGLILRDNVARYRSTHRPGLDLGDLEDLVGNELKELATGRRRMEQWTREPARPGRWNAWADKTLAASWGPTAATRVLQVLREGTDPGDIRLVPKLPPSRQPLQVGQPVPGAPAMAETLYDCFQALTWIAAHSGGPAQRDERTRQAHRLLIQLLRN